MLLIGCDVSGALKPKIEKGKYDQIVGGMNAKQIIEILGEPTSMGENRNAGMPGRQYSESHLIYDGSNVNAQFQLQDDMIIRKFTIPNGEWDDDTTFYEQHPLYRNQF